MEDMRNRAIHLLSRLTFGLTEQDIERVIEMGEEAWLDAQLAPGSEANPKLRAALSEFETLDMTSGRLYRFLTEDLAGETQQEKRQALQRKRREPRNELLRSIALRNVQSSRQVEAVLSDFFRNHLNVSFTKGGSEDYLITDYDRSVVRGNALGQFPAMLRASAKHPAMLYFLDNHLSRRPPSKQELAQVERRARRRTGSRQQGEEAAQIAAQRGLNENYARELLELHTLGVDNYYKQKDVIAVAEALTGWTFDGGREGSWEFRFRGDMHAAGDKKVLGKLIREDRQQGIVEGEQVLDILCKHKGTADFIAMKMVRYFVADQPPKSLVKEVAKTFRKTDGDIPSMLRTIVKSEEFWKPETIRGKFRTPLEFVCAALRATEAQISNPDRCLQLMRDMGQPLYHCDDPTGYYDTAESWLDPGVMALRWQFAIDLASNKIKGVRVPDPLYDDLPQEIPRLWQHHLTKKLLPGGASQRTRNALSTVTDEYLAKTKLADSRVLGAQLVGLLLGSPEFQQQ
jgi:uncharacterized protein (DUF1800 family)